MPEYGNPKIHVRVSHDVLSDLDAIADELGTRRSSIMREALEAYLATLKDQIQSRDISTEVSAA
jgi:predicted transcriptional regulator